MSRWRAQAPRGRAHERIAIWRIRDRSVDDGLDAHAAQNRYLTDRPLDVVTQAIEVIFEQLIGKFLRNAVEPMGFGIPLIGTEQQGVPFLAQVIAHIRIADQR